VTSHRRLPAGAFASARLPARAIGALDEVAVETGDADFVLGPARPGARLNPVLSGEQAPAAGVPWRQEPSVWLKKRFGAPARRLVRLHDAIHAGQGVLLDRTGAAFDLSCPRYGRPNRGWPLSRSAGGLESAEAVAIEVRHAGGWLSLGDLPDQFGHFLLEAPSRLWAARWALAAGLGLTAQRAAPLSAWQAELIAACGVDPAAILLDPGPASFETLLVPAPHYELHTAVHPLLRSIHAAIARSLAPDASRPRRRIYLDRAMTASRPLVNAHEIAALFARSGFEVIAPETLPIAAQVRLAAEAEVIAGPAGSQLYLAAFQAQGRGVVSLAPPGFVLPDDAMLARLRGAEARYVVGSPAGEAAPPIRRAYRIDPADAAAALAGLG
jgi:glycosyl transferase family 61